MAGFADIKKDADNLKQVRKVLEAVAFIAPETVDFIETLTDTDGTVLPLPTGYIPVGVVTRDGYTIGGDTETEPVDALGYPQPIREDITSYTRTVTFTAYEVFRREILSLAYGMDLSSVTRAVSGEITFDRPNLPEQLFYRLIIIGKDGSGDNEIYRAKAFPRVTMAEVPEEAWATDALSYEITLNTYIDDEVGSGEREFIAGPGAKSDTVLGFTDAPTD